jgi:stearoyl-CoA desaturase (Delta-9 desaturase)
VTSAVATEEETVYRWRRNRWGPILFVGGATLGTLAAPFYVARFGVSPLLIALLAVYSLACSLSITAGYHRLFAHRTYEANVLVRLSFLFFGAGAFEQSALKWSSFHRTHHAYTDTPRDPHNIRYGFFYAHAGWILLWKPFVDYGNVPDLMADRLVRHQHEHYRLWSLAAGVGVPLALGLALGDVPGALLLGVLVRCFLVLNSAFLVNSVAHSFGSRPFDAASSATDSALTAFLTHGEGYHNFHHAFPGDYRNGVAWYAWDPTKWGIWALSLVGLARDLKRTPGERVLAARS